MGTWDELLLPPIDPASGWQCSSGPELRPGEDEATSGFQALETIRLSDPGPRGGRLCDARIKPWARRWGGEVAVFGGVWDSPTPPPPCVQPCCRPLCYEQSERRLHKSLQMKMEEMSLSGLDNSKLEVRAPPRVPLGLSLGVSASL